MGHVEIITTGNEVLVGEVVNTNAVHVANGCHAEGWTVLRHVTVGDTVDAIAAACRDARARAECVVVTGGLGPTSDDLTYEAAAQAFDRPLVFSDSAWQQTQEFCAARNRDCPPANRKQAFVPEGAEVLTNELGTAPAVRLGVGPATFFFLPGVPSEVEWLFGQHIQPWLRAHRPTVTRAERVLKCFGISEAVLGERVQGLALAETQVGYRLIYPDVAIKLQVVGAEWPQLVQRLDQLEARVRAVLGDAVFGTGDATLASVVGERLTARGESLAVAESCTGGELCSTLTDVPGASAFFERGVITYSNHAKVELLGVPREVLLQCGAVSAEVAEAMAVGARTRARTTYGIGITGIAGPSGGSEEKPVGTVYIGVATPHTTLVHHECSPRSRRYFKQWVAAKALDLLRNVLP
ncbi:MAG: competence/damage-inducible protein A [Deltaproteobacteria bacterium]|nr:competence/damage-inducible protein A [Deltaproteobacteria bacterium]